MFGKDAKKPENGVTVRFPGVRTAADGSEVVVAMETAASEAAGAYPITPSTQMGEGWAVAVAAGKTNVNGRRLIFFEPEGEHAAAAVTAGMSMTGLRSANFSSGQGIAYMHESLYAAAGKRLTYVLNVAARAMTKHALNVHAGHDDYHAVDDTGFFQLFAKDVQEAADLNLIAHRVAELGLTPGIVAQDGFLTSHVIESVLLPEREMIKEYLGDPADIIDSPTAAQRHVFGEKRRRIPELFDLDYPAMFGVVQNQDSYAQGVAAQRPFYFDHLQGLTDQAMAEFGELTGRDYARVMGYKLEDAEYVILGQGSVVSNAEAVVDYLRETQGIKVGVMNLVMFRPFPSDLITRMLSGMKAVTVLERVDQPLAADAPLLREIRSAMSQALENSRGRQVAKPRGLFGGGNGNGPEADQELPYPELPEIQADQMPDFYSGGFGFGSRDLQPTDLIAAIENMLEGGRNQRFYYLGIDFIRKGTKSPKMEIWQNQLLEDYPDLEHLSLQAGPNPDLHPEGSVAIRIHSVGGWGAITTGKNLAMTAFDLFGLYVKANPKYGSEKKGQPTNFFAILSPEPVKLNGELKHVNVVLSPDPNVFSNGEPLAGLADGGVFVIQTDQTPEVLWESFPPQAQRTIRDRNIRVLGLDGFKIASEEASDPDLRYRMQGAAFMGGFFAVSPLAERHGLTEAELFEGIADQLQKKFGKRGQHVVDDNVRVIRRGFDEIFEVPHGEVSEDAGGGLIPHIPSVLDNPEALPGLGNTGRFWEQVCAYCETSGEDVIADPFAAISAIPAATSTVRDMSNIRFEVPDFIADRCTGCSQCWVQCPDAAIPGLVNTVEEILDTALLAAQNGKPLSLLKQVSKHIARESRKILEGVPFKTFGDVASSAYSNVMTKLKWSPERRAEVDAEWARVFPILVEMPLAKTTPFFDLPERKDPGSGGLLSITVNPEACKGCNICVDVCPEHALITVKQDVDILGRLRRNWKVWEQLPDTDDKYINIHDLEAGMGVLSSLLLKKKNYQSMAGGDGACMGCGEKTAVHILVATIEGVMVPRVAKLVHQLDEMIAGLDLKARKLLASEADLTEVNLSGSDEVDLHLTDEEKVQFERLTNAKQALEALRWRYTEGPGGKGRSPLGIANSTGCSSVWGSTYPYNPYPFPWVNHLFQDAPSIAIGIFEGHMRKMADGFIDVRRARLLLDDEYDAETDEEFFEAFEYNQFTDTEFDLCPPILAMGGDGAMLDIGFQNLSRLMASGKPLRVVILDTQVYSNTGGQSCTSGYTGQIADMAPYGKAQKGKTEERKEVSYIAMAHRGTFVLQSSQALPSHMMNGIIKALQTKRPAVINLYTPCPVEHGLPDEWAPHGARLALESRAFPFLIYDPDAGDSIAECLDLSANPAVDDLWPTYTLDYIAEDGSEAKMDLPVTTADWAATEGRFSKHFTRIETDAWSDDQVPFAELVELEADEREGKTPFVWTLDPERKLERTLVSQEMIQLAEERLQFWAQLRELGGLEIPPVVRKRVARSLESELEGKLQALRTEYEAKITELQTSYPRMIARQMAEGLLKHGNGSRTVAEILTEAEASTGLEPIGVEWGSGGGTAVASPSTAVVAGAEVAVAPSSQAAPAASAPAVEAPPAVAPADADDDDLALEPWIDTDQCTTCNECTNINGQLFAYNDAKQAYIKDASAGTFQQIVKAAESCPAEIIHPGTPLDPDEPDLEKWVKRAERFN